MFSKFHRESFCTFCLCLPLLFIPSCSEGSIPEHSVRVGDSDTIQCELSGSFHEQFLLQWKKNYTVDDDGDRCGRKHTHSETIAHWGYNESTMYHENEGRVDVHHTESKLWSNLTLKVTSMFSDGIYFCDLDGQRTNGTKIIPYIYPNTSITHEYAERTCRISCVCFSSPTLTSMTLSVMGENYTNSTTEENVSQKIIKTTISITIWNQSSIEQNISCSVVFRNEVITVNSTIKEEPLTMLSHIKETTSGDKEAFIYLLIASSICVISVYLIIFKICIEIHFILRVYQKP